MRKILNAAIAVWVCLGSAHLGIASSHREAPLISSDPLADNTDLYAFRSPCDPNNIILIANYIPFEHPAGGPNWYTFGENIRYEIHIDNNTSTTGAEIIYRFTFQQQNQDPSTFFRIRLGKENWKTTYTLERSMNGGVGFTTIVSNGIVPPPNIGPRSIENSVGLGAASYASLMTSAIATATTGEKVFAGPVDDPFFVDLGGAFDVGGFRVTGRDGLAKFNCHSLVIEVPISTLQKTGLTASQAANILDANFVIGVYATASRQQISTFDPDGGNGTSSGSWIQVSRLGMPLTNEVIIPIGMKDQWNFTTTNSENVFIPFFKNPELALYMDDSKFGSSVPGLAALRIQSNSLAQFDFRNGRQGLYSLKGTTAVTGTAFDDAIFGTVLLPENGSPRSVDLLPLFTLGVPNISPYQLAVLKGGNPLAPGKPFINNFLPTLGDMLRLNMAVPPTPRNSADFSSDGLINAAVLGLTDSRFNTTRTLQFIPNMDGFPNGRRLEDDVARIELQAVGGVVLAAIGYWYDDFTGGNPITPQFINALSFTAGPTANDTTFQPCFPFVQTPWRGFLGAQFAQAPLPVTYQSFTAEKQGLGVMLRWKISDQLNNDRFEIEHNSGGSFKQVGTVSGSANLNDYEFFHASPSLDKVNQYRLKQIDKDGHFSYSIIRKVQFAGKNVFLVHPNPATDKISVSSDKTGFFIYLYDQAGRKLRSQLIVNGVAEIDIKSLSKGVYILVAEKDGNQLAAQQILKQ
jgi:hypothetical protein